MTDDFKPPYETPDAVISGSSRMYRRPCGLHSRLMMWLRKLLRRKPKTQSIMFHIIYRDWKERVEIVHLAPNLIMPFIEKLMEAPAVRQVYAAELLFKGRKTFGADYDPKHLTEFLEKAVA